MITAPRLPRYVTFTFNASTFVNVPSATETEALAYYYVSPEDAALAAEYLKAREFPYQVEVIPHGKFEGEGMKRYRAKWNALDQETLF